MSFKEQYIELFDNYLENEMSTQERIVFENTLQEDEDFAKHFEEYKSFTKHLKESLEQDLITDIAKAQTKHFTFLKYKRIAWVSASILCLIGLLYVSKQHFKTESKSSITPALPLKDNITPEHRFTKSSDSCENSSLESPFLDSSRTPQKNKSENNTINKIDDKNFTLTLHKLIKCKETKVYFQNDTIVVESTEELTKIIPFTKDKNFYLMLNNSIYKQNGLSLDFHKDNRISELLGKATGRGKKQKIKVIYYHEETTNEKASKDSNSFYIDNQNITKTNFDEIQSLNNIVYKRSTYFLNIDDLYNLENN